MVVTYTISENGNYEISVTDAKGNKSTYPVKITTIDKTKPVATISPNGGNKYVMPSIGNAKIITRLTASDTGGSGLRLVQYAWSQNSGVEPSNWVNFSATGQTITKSDINQPGTWYLWTRVTDIAGNRAESIKVSNAFTIGSNSDVANKITLTADKTDWTNRKCNSNSKLWSKFNTKQNISMRWNCRNRLSCKRTYKCSG